MKKLILVQALTTALCFLAFIIISAFLEFGNCPASSWVIIVYVAGLIVFPISRATNKEYLSYYTEIGFCSNVIWMAWPISWMLTVYGFHTLELLLSVGGLVSLAVCAIYFGSYFYLPKKLVALSAFCQLAVLIVMAICFYRFG